MEGFSPQFQIDELMQISLPMYDANPQDKTPNPTRNTNLVEEPQQSLETIFSLPISEIASEAQNTLHNVINLAKEIFSIIKDSTSGNVEGGSISILETKKREFIANSKRLKSIVVKLSELLKETPPPNQSPDPEIIQKREEIRKKNETIKKLMDRMIQLQFEIQAMMTIGVPPNGWIGSGKKSESGVSLTMNSNSTPQTTRSTSSFTGLTPPNTLTTFSSPGTGLSGVTLLPPPKS